jgi:predicted HAD superfamily Cof-like phosphohydrolase
MAVEELAEWIEAHVASDLTAAADAWADRAYLLFGDAVATGLGTEALFDEVHRSNMTKAPVNPATGKAVKSDGYLAPVISLDAADEPGRLKHSASG